VLVEQVRKGYNTFRPDSSYELAIKMIAIPVTTNNGQNRPNPPLQRYVWRLFSIHVAESSDTRVITLKAKWYHRAIDHPPLRP